MEFFYRFTLPSYVKMKNFEGMDLEKLDEAVGD
jgi:hypothetical protein